ncbi:MAG: tripartite tricarboxylate transporter substrate binding protein [Pigmentiphaga sp.]|uniref:Bug family tripartite tricarboxylate transporter substrate binding protein n=1 Tax=Pigmentiphaga sp. TaxID=1977564 RepID=UPI0029A33335|nr:tripartite tricarboxylate transporter substrate binding protein [Pigmentiphaga sp.]MDX3904423.1 tripartite tricarboxylate transporter substrate binding protein [Pigmentiphaga sp.]
MMSSHSSLGRRALLALAAATAAGAATATFPAFAANYPTRPITIVVAYGAGGDTDAMARLFGEKLSQRLGQPVIVENRAGASGIIGSNYAARAKPDGYTLLLAPSTFAMATHVVKTNSAGTYHPVRDFAPVTQTASQPLLLVASQASGYTSAEQVVKDAKAGKALTYASPGSGSPMHILGELFNQAAGVKIAHIPYKGVAPAVNDLLGGHVALSWMTYGPVEPYLASGKVRILANGAAKRTPLAPDAPSMAELGYKTIDMAAWQGLYAPKGTPEEVIRTLNSHMAEVLKMPDVVEKMRVFGSFAQSSTPEGLGKLTAGDYEYFGKVVKEFGIQAD